MKVKIRCNILRGDKYLRESDLMLYLYKFKNIYIEQALYDANMIYGADAVNCIINTLESLKEI